MLISNMLLNKRRRLEELLASLASELPLIFLLDIWLHNLCKFTVVSQINDLNEVEKICHSLVITLTTVLAWIDTITIN